MVLLQFVLKSANLYFKPGAFWGRSWLGEGDEACRCTDFKSKEKTLDRLSLTFDLEAFGAGRPWGFLLQPETGQILQAGPEPATIFDPPS